MLAFGAAGVFSWDGQSWTALAGDAALPNHGAVSVVSEGAHTQIVAIGQDNNGVSVWRWQGGKWQPVVAASSPPAGCAVSNPVYDPELSGIVLTDLPADCKIYALP